jgi:hypothetical protein
MEAFEAFEAHRCLTLLSSWTLPWAHRRICQGQRASYFEANQLKSNFIESNINAREDLFTFHVSRRVEPWIGAMRFQAHAKQFKHTL